MPKGDLALSGLADFRGRVAEMVPAFVGHAIAVGARPGSHLPGLRRVPPPVVGLQLCQSDGGGGYGVGFGHIVGGTP